MFKDIIDNKIKYNDSLIGAMENNRMKIIN